MSGYIKQLETELLDTEAMIVSLAQTIESEIANAMSSAVIGLIDGTTKVEDALANMFEAISEGRSSIWRLNYYQAAGDDDCAAVDPQSAVVRLAPGQVLFPTAPTAICLSLV